MNKSRGQEAKKGSMRGKEIEGKGKTERMKEHIQYGSKKGLLEVKDVKRREVGRLCG